jgi:hypothetical protein
MYNYVLYIHRVETALHKKQARSHSSNFPNIAVRLEYTALSPIQLDQPEMSWPISQAGREGTLPGMLCLIKL